MNMVARERFSSVKMILFYRLPAKLTRFFAKLTWSGVPGGGIRGRDGAGLSEFSGLPMIGGEIGQSMACIIGKL
jgi:hypothetical protein